MQSKDIKIGETYGHRTYKRAEWAKVTVIEGPTKPKHAQISRLTYCLVKAGPEFAHNEFKVLTKDLKPWADCEAEVNAAEQKRRAQQNAYACYLAEWGDLPDRAVKVTSGAWLGTTRRDGLHLTVQEPEHAKVMLDALEAHLSTKKVADLWRARVEADQKKAKVQS